MFVCDNLAFSSAIVKQQTSQDSEEHWTTSTILRDLGASRA
jgi:hypothetical protein